MAEAAEIADALYAWASRNGILTPAAQREAASRSGDPSKIPFSSAEAEFFRARPINRIRSSSEANGSIVTVFTRQVIAERKRQRLTKTFAQRYEAEGIRLVITTAPSYKVDQSLQNFGPFVPIRRHQGRIACGSSIGIGNQRNAGTLTAIAIDDQDQLFGLSCNHVVGGCNTALPGTPIVIPGIQDVSADFPEITVIGKHYSGASMSQGVPAVLNIDLNADLACFEVTTAGLENLTSFQGSGDEGYDTPATFVDTVQPQLPVQKWGRSTGHTTGRISSVLTDPEPIEYNVTSFYGPQSSQTFRGTIYYPTVYEVVGLSGRPFSVGGDSGSLVVTRETGAEPRIVGILIAGGSDKSVVLPLQPMLDQLKLRLVTAYPPPPGPGP